MQPVAKHGIPGTERRWRWLATIALLGIFLLYFPLNRPWGTVHVLRLSIDDRIPEVPVFVVPYLLGFYALLVLGYLWFLRMPGVQYWRLALGLALGLLLSDVVYRTFQTTVPRTASLDRSVFGAALNWVRSADAPYSAFPSQHTLLTLLCTWNLWRVVDRWWRPLLVLNAGLILAATLLLRQHFVLDIVAGAALAFTIAAALEVVVSPHGRSR